MHVGLRLGRGLRRLYSQTADHLLHSLRLLCIVQRRRDFGIAIHRTTQGYHALIGINANLPPTQRWIGTDLGLDIAGNLRIRALAAYAAREVRDDHNGRVHLFLMLHDEAHTRGKAVRVFGVPSPEQWRNVLPGHHSISFSTLSAHKQCLPS